MQQVLVIDNAMYDGKKLVCMDYVGQLDQHQIINYRHGEVLDINKCTIDPADKVSLTCWPVSQPKGQGNAVKLPLAFHSLFTFGLD